MNSYFFKMTKEEKNTILDQHKQIYDGYVTQYVKPNQEPLYTQDFANDKNGITINNKGTVTSYKNMNINESDAFTGSKYVPEESFEQTDDSIIVSSGYNPIDRIGDGDEDLEHGTFGSTNNDIVCPKCGGNDPNCELCGEPEFEYDYEDDETKMNDDFGPIDLDFDDLEEDEISNLMEEVSKTKDMFKRFNNFN